MTTLRVTAPPGGWAPPWPVVIEIASVLPPRSWVLVGGLMVQLHARAAAVEEIRPTHDVDALIDVMAAGVSMAGITGALAARGFEVVDPGQPGSTTSKPLAASAPVIPAMLTPAAMTSMRASTSCVGRISSTAAARACNCTMSPPTSTHDLGGSTKAISMTTGHGGAHPPGGAV